MVIGIPLIFSSLLTWRYVSLLLCETAYFKVIGFIKQAIIALKYGNQQNIYCGGKLAAVKVSPEERFGVDKQDNTDLCSMVNKNCFNLKLSELD